MLTYFVHSGHLALLSMLLSGVLSCLLQRKIHVDFLFLALYWKLKRYNYGAFENLKSGLFCFDLLNECSLGTNNIYDYRNIKRKVMTQKHWTCYNKWMSYVVWYRDATSFIVRIKIVAVLSLKEDAQNDLALLLVQIIRIEIQIAYNGQNLKVIEIIVKDNRGQNTSKNN